ncbi:hypothetical protein BDR06DRAFT_892528, partial [Suillus hirtellus]
IRSVKSLRNGGLTVELETESLAQWLNSPAGRIALKTHLETTVSFRHRMFTVVLEYLPIQTQIEQEDFLQKVEQENNLPPLLLASIRWIKPPMKRSAKQRKAFTLLQITDIHTANDIL